MLESYGFVRIAEKYSWNIVTTLWIIMLITAALFTAVEVPLSKRFNKKGVVNMSNPKYDDEFKKSIVALYQSGKSQSQISKEYGVSLSAISRLVLNAINIK